MYFDCVPAEKLLETDSCWEREKSVFLRVRPMVGQLHTSKRIWAVQTVFDVAGNTQNRMGSEKGGSGGFAGSEQDQMLYLLKLLLLLGVYSQGVKIQTSHLSLCLLGPPSCCCCLVQSEASCLRWRTRVGSAGLTPASRLPSQSPSGTPASGLHR